MDTAAKFVSAEFIYLWFLRQNDIITQNRYQSLLNPVAPSDIRAPQVCTNTFVANVCRG